MGDTTGIEWTDSTMNWWEGCTKVGPGCDHCYAEARDIRWHEGSHWGPGAPRRQMSQQTRNAPFRWQKAAEEFQRLRGHPQRVFASSLSDFFDNEVPRVWREEAWDAIAITPDLRYQICTKRLPNVSKMLSEVWKWPDNAGLLVTTVTQEEVDRDLPRLLELKAELGIPWVGLSVEPMLGPVSFRHQSSGLIGKPHLDWVIIGGESGPHARPFDLDWAYGLVDECRIFGIAAFVKQMGDNPRHVGDPAKFTGKGKDPAEWPLPLRVRQFPAGLQ